MFYTYQNYFAEDKKSGLPKCITKDDVGQLNNNNRECSYSQRIENLMHDIYSDSIHVTRILQKIDDFFIDYDVLHANQRSLKLYMDSTN